MPIGLQTFDTSGNLIVDLTSRLGRYIGHIDVVAGESGSRAVSIPQGTTFYFQIIPLGNLTPYRYPADVKYVNGIMSWTFIQVGAPFYSINSRIIYGYY